LVLDDSYNANPTSFTALFEAAREIRTNSAAGIKRVIAVVGDMLELGPESPRFHREMGELAADHKVNALLAVGGFAKHWIEGHDSRGTRGVAEVFADKEALKQKLKSLLASSPSDTLVLVKGSRGSKMDDIVSALRL